MPLPTSHRIDMLHGPLVTRIIAFALPIPDRGQQSAPAAVQLRRPGGRWTLRPAGGAGDGGGRLQQLGDQPDRQPLRRSLGGCERGGLHRHRPEGRETGLQRHTQLDDGSHRLGRVPACGHTRRCTSHPHIDGHATGGAAHGGGIPQDICTGHAVHHGLQLRIGHPQKHRRHAPPAVLPHLRRRTERGAEPPAGHRLPSGRRRSRNSHRRVERRELHAGRGLPA